VHHPSTLVHWWVLVHFGPRQYKISKKFKHNRCMKTNVSIYYQTRYASVASHMARNRVVPLFRNYITLCVSLKERSPSLTICYVGLWCNVEPPYNLISIYSIQPMHPNFPHLIKQYLVKPYQHKKIYVSINKLSLIHARIVYRFEVWFRVKLHTIAISSFCIEIGTTPHENDCIFSWWVAWHLLLAMNCLPKLKGQSHNPTMTCNVCHQTEIRTVPLWQQQMPNLHLIYTWIKEKEKKNSNSNIILCTFLLSDTNISW
jgi:hypothetical protein